MLQHKDAIINMIFDNLPQSPDKFTHFLSDLVTFLPMVKADTLHVISHTHPQLVAKGAGCVLTGKPLLFVVQNAVSSKAFLLL